MPVTCAVLPVICVCIAGTDGSSRQQPGWQVTPGRQQHQQQQVTSCCSHEFVILVFRFSAVMSALPSTVAVLR